MNSRAKGAAGERELAEFLRERGWPARRGQQRSGLDQADVIDGPEGWHIEVKRVERLNVWDAFEQAARDADQMFNSPEPMVAMRRNRSEWLAVVRLDSLLDLIACYGRLRLEILKCNECGTNEKPAGEPNG